MSNILRVTSPIPGYDNKNALKIEGEQLPSKQIQGPVMPDKVVRTDARSDAAYDQKEAALKFGYETNFDNFVQQIMKSSNMTEEIAKVFVEKFKTTVESGISNEFAETINNFLSMIEMNESDILPFLQMQGQSSVKFKGAFFEVLRQAFFSSASSEIRSQILDFLKKYTDMAEGNHLLKEIEMNIKTAKTNVFSSAKDQISEIEKEINYSAEKGNVKQNAKIIKNKLLPFLNEYIKTMHDRGSMRESTAELAYLTSRYENGDMERLIKAFKDLVKLPILSEKFGGLNPELLDKILSSTDFEKASEKNTVMMKLADIIEKGAKGAAGIENKTAFKQMMNSILLNESVYMPLMHMSLPISVNGKLMYSEMWIDPEAENGYKGENGEIDQYIKGLVKFDIQDLGFFDLFFIYAKGEKNTVSIQLHYPEKLVDNEREIKSNIRRIAKENGLELSDVVLDTSKKSIPISEAFPEVFERRNTVNVKI